MKKKFNAFSLIEMTLTLAILTIVFLLTTKTITTVVQVATITKYKTMTRDEANFSMEFIERVLANANIKREGEDIFIYDTLGMKFYDPTTGAIVYNETDPAIDAEYATATTAGAVGNEFHVNPYNYLGWMCIGYFTENGDDTKGYLLKRSVDSLPSGHNSCFDSSWGSSSYPIMVLNSEDINVNDFKISFNKSELVNNIFYVDLEFEPLFWAPGVSSIEKAVIRQAVITTQGLTWY